MTDIATNLAGLTAAEKRSALMQLLQERAERQSAGSPLSAGQQALWFLHRLAPDTAAYNIPFAVRIHDTLDMAALDRTLQALAGRHAALRTIYAQAEGEPVQRIHSQTTIPLAVIDAAGWSDETLDRELHQQCQLPFDLATGPLARAWVYATAPDEHVLLLVFHHIAVDLWSMTVLLRELGHLYAAETTGQPASLPPLTSQYADYVQWQGDQLAGAEGERLWAYWQRQLGGELPQLDLPTDRVRPAIQTYHGASVPFAVPKTLMADLKALARSQAVTLYTVLAAALQVLLHRYSGQDEILVGSPIAGRDRADFAQVVGYFVNPVVLRGSLAGNPSFQDFLAQMGGTVRDALIHQGLPFPTLVERLQPDRDPSRSPLFQVLFSLQSQPGNREPGVAEFVLSQPGSTLQLGGLHLETYPLATRVAQFDLSLTMVETADGLAGSLAYNTDLFDGPTMTRWTAHLQTLLAAIVAAPETGVGQLPILEADEAQAILIRWNDTARAYPQAACLHHLFEQQAATSPDALAVHCGSETLTYAELNARANQVAHHLRTLSVGPETLVGLYLERSTSLLVGLLGILKAGGAYVPLDPSFPADRLAAMLDDADARILVTQASLADKLPVSGTGSVCLDRDWERIATQPTQNPGVPVPPDALAYVIYTSGSTGKPKGVQLAHGGVVNFLASMQQTPGLSVSDVLVAVTTISFDIAVLELFLPLTVGARVVIASREESTDAALLMALLSASDATVMQATPATWRMLLEAGWQGQSGLTVLCGGEAMPRDVADRLLERSRAIWNMYGPTETTIWSTVERVAAGTGVIPIGRPIANTVCYVLDAHLQPVPPGVAGELHIGGDGVARGYLNRPALTEEKFVPNPHGRGRIYKTGDMARYWPDGRLECLGRIDHQVKIRGFRIELGEIEIVLEQAAGVQQAVVVAREDVPGDKRLVAYLIPEPGIAFVWDDLRQHARAVLPEYMIPLAFVAIDRLPMTANNKVDRKALPAPDWGQVTTERILPRDAREVLIAGIWSDVLGLEQVGVLDNFFELGGHSLLATRVMSRLRQAFEIDVPLRILFEQPTVAGLSQAVAVRQLAEPGQSPPPIMPIERHGDVPVSFAQQRLWFLDQLEPGSAAYNMPAALRLTGTLQIPVLTAVLTELVRRHESLRTTIVTVSGEPMQHIAPAGPVPLPVIDLSGVTDDARAQALQQAIDTEANHPFDLAAGPLFRATLVRLGAESHVLLVTMHHIVSDGWSIGILVDETAALYAAYVAGVASPLPELAVQYADYAVWQRFWLQGEPLSRLATYWKDKLSGELMPLSLPTDRQRPARQSIHGAAQRHRLPADLSGQLAAVGKRRGATLYMVLLAAYQTLLYRLSNQSDIIVASPIAGRTQTALEIQAGFFVNTLAMRT
ncbi:MAG: amino acid adenylation domain-containing protein, partial [Candidatus Sericytochromatia bacterium]|nr:amino acid adenylation domain-containing protein [Candidatus Sericytochromatia bacterium]